MASLADSNAGSVPIEQLETLHRRLLGEDREPNHDALHDSQPKPQTPERDDEDADASERLPSTVQESLVEASYRTPNSSPWRAKPRLQPSESAPSAMAAMVQSESQDQPKIIKAASFNGKPPDGDTQECPTQTWETFTTSMAVTEEQAAPEMSERALIRSGDRTPEVSQDGEKTPERSHAGRGDEPKTMESQITNGITQTPRTAMEGVSGYVNLMTGYVPSSPAVSPTGSTQGMVDDLLDDNEQTPETQFRVPAKPSMPETPSMAGQKHGRDGEPITSVTTSKTNGLSQFFAGNQGPLLSNTQLFAQTQSHSSPNAHEPRSYSSITRPSPNINDLTRSSPALFMSSPFATMHPGPNANLDRRRLQKFNLRRNSSGDVEDFEQEDDDMDDSQDRVTRTNLRRTMSDRVLGETQLITAPQRPGSRNSRPPSSRRKPEPINLDTPAPAKDIFNISDDEAEEEDVMMNEEEELVLHEDEDNADSKEQNEDDEYDEYGEIMLRSQADYADQDRDESVAESVEAEDVEANHLDEAEGPLDDIEYAQAPDQPSHTQGTQRSTVADSQPTAEASKSQQVSIPQVQHSSMQSFIPGSHYAGKTSEEEAILASSQRRSQSRVAASQVSHEVSNVSADKVPSSPPLPAVGSAGAEEPFEFSLAPQYASKQLDRQTSSREDDSVMQQEIPESDLPELDPQQKQSEQQVTIQNDEETQETNGAPFSTARTHVSGSARSPAKSSAAPSPLKQMQSQQSRLTDPSPRKQAGVRRFADMMSQLDSQTSFEKNVADVDSIMDGIMTEEDRMLLEATSDASEPPPPKRRRISRKASAQISSPEVNKTVTHLTSHSQPDVDMDQQLAGSEANGTIPESEANAEEPPQALRDSLSKANEMVAPLAEVIQNGKETQIAERAGARAVSQLIAARPMGKPAKAATYGRRTRRKSSRTERSATKKAKKAEPAEATDDEESQVEVEGVNEPVEESMLDVTDADVDSRAPALDNHSAGALDESTADSLVKETNLVNGKAPTGHIVASKRVFAWFRGSFNAFYTATWLGASADGMSYKIQFDDGNITDLEIHHVRALELRVGDNVKIDIKGLKKDTWRVVGFGFISQNDEERKLGDVFGHTHVKVQAKSSRGSLAKDAPSATPDEEGETRQVPVRNIYMTHTLWNQFDRPFTRPSTVRSTSARAETPSAQSITPSTETPESRSRRAIMPTKAKARASHLREGSVASSGSTAPTAIFGGMAFAISYAGDDVEKAEVTRQIQRNGGLVLNDGFEELFELPTIDEPASPKKKSPQKQKAKEAFGGLSLKAEHKSLTFVALIADRHTRRAKYMQALALGLPTLAGRWVKDSLDASKNPTIMNGEITPLAWNKYLLPSGESSYLGGAIRSRVLAPYEAKSCDLERTVVSRPILLNGESVIIVASKKAKASWDKRKTFVFLTLALGASEVKRVNDLQEAKAIVDENPQKPTWVYIDGSVADFDAAPFDKASAVSKKRKRGSEMGLKPEAGKMSRVIGNVKIVNDEYVVQSLILGDLVD